MPILVKRVLSSTVKFYLSKFKHIHQLSDIYINLETNFIETFVKLKKNFASINLSQP